MQSGLFISGVTGSGKGVYMRLIENLLGPKCCRLDAQKLTVKELNSFDNYSVLIWPDADYINDEQLACLRSLLGRDTGFKEAIIIASQSSPSDFFSKGGTAIRDRFCTIEFYKQNPLYSDFEKELNSDCIDGLINWVLSTPNSFYEKIIRSGAFNRKDLQSSSLGHFILENIRPLDSSKELHEEVSPIHLFQRYTQDYEKNNMAEERLKRKGFEFHFQEFINTHFQITTHILYKKRKKYFSGIGLLNSTGVSDNERMRLTEQSLHLDPLEIDKNCYLSSPQEQIKDLFAKATAKATKKDQG